MELSLGGYLQLVVWAVFVNNFILAQFLGICPFLGVSKKIESAIGMSLAVIFVMTVASVVTWLLYQFLLVPFDLVFLKTIVFILVIAALVQFVEMVIKKVSPALFQALGIFLPLITTNCAVLGAALLAIQKEFAFFTTLIYALASSVGFGLVLVVFAGIRQRMEITTETPKLMRGMPVTLVAASILSLAFLGFAGLVKM
ncbi:MAG: electron transport complex subunit RsxA [Myxococcales bacterium]|jgi:electron transport complex protein RnfA